MATNIDKTLFQAPGGMDEMPPEDAFDGDAIEIEIVDPEEVTIGMGDMELTLRPEEPTLETFDSNLAEFLDEGFVSALASELSADIDNDRMSRKDWEDAYVEGLKLLGLKIEERAEPWLGASGVFHPMITEAVVRFQSETIMETFPANGPVRTKVLGKETSERLAAAARVQADMNYQLTERMTEFRSEHERMLWNLPATGSAFKKVYWDPNLGRQTSVFVPAEDILLPYGTSDITRAPRVTHVMRKTKNDILKLQQSGFYLDVELGEPDKATDEINKAKDEETGFSDINDDRFTLYEVHVDLAIPDDPYGNKDDDGDPTDIAVPYVLTMVRGTNTVLAIRRNWEEDDRLTIKRDFFVHYQYIPGFGAYGFGFFHLIGGFAKSATSLMRQLIDAGTLSNLPGGLKSRGLRIKGDDNPIAPGEFRDVDVGSGTIRDNILPLPYKEPSQVLYTLLNNVVEEGRRFASTADMKISDMSAQAPVGTTLALLERQLKVMTAVQARVHFALKQELKLIKNLIRDYSDDDYEYEPSGDEGPRAKRSDYNMVEVIPVSDPNAATLSQRVVQYQAVIQLAQAAPDIYDLPKLHRGMLEVLGIKNADKLVPLAEDMKPTDPVTENMDVLRGKPVKAFAYQDHQAHLQVHMAMLQDPSIMATIGQNPQAPKISAALMAHIAEHTAYNYRAQIESNLGTSLPGEDENGEFEHLPPQIETSLSSMMAKAAQVTLQQNQAQAQQAQAQQQAQDPVLQMQMQELQLKQQQLALKQQELQVKAQMQAKDLQLKGAKIIGDLAAKDQQLELDGEELRVNAQARGMEISSDIEHKKATLAAKQQLEGAKLGVTIAKDAKQNQGTNNQ